MGQNGYSKKLDVLIRTRLQAYEKLIDHLDIDALILVDGGVDSIMRGDEEIPLTNKEFSLLEYLILNKNKVVTRTMISEHVWDIHFDAGSNVIDVIINYLRRKIEMKGGEKLIHTIRGAGYMLKDDKGS